MSGRILWKKVTVLQRKKAQIATEIDKSSKFYRYLTFYATFTKFLKDFVDQNFKNLQQRINLLSKKGGWGDKISFVVKKSHNAIKVVKKIYFFIFFGFLKPIFMKSWTFWWIRTREIINKNWISCSVGFLKEKRSFSDKNRF